MKTKGIVIVTALAGVVAGTVLFFPMHPPRFRTTVHPPIDTTGDERMGDAIYTLMDRYFASINSRADFAVHCRGYHRMSPGTRRGIRWPLASLTKHFTGYLLAGLVCDGRLSWNDKLASRVEAFTGNPVGDVTIDHLCRHTSAVDSPTLPDYWMMTHFDREDHSGEFMEHGLSHCHMSEVKSLYSDYNYTLLRLIIDSVERYDDLFHRKIQLDLGLTETRLELRNGTAPVHIKGYYSLASLARPYSPVCIPMPAWNISMLKGAVGVASSVGDLYRWYGHLRGVFSEGGPMAREYFPSLDGTYRNGWIRTLGTGGTAIFHHGGLVPGFASFIVMDFDRDIFAVYICDVSVWKSNYNIDAEIINIIKGMPYRSGTVE